MGRRRTNIKKRKILPGSGNEVDKEQPGSSRKQVKVTHTNPCQLSESRGEGSVQEAKQDSHPNAENEGRVKLAKAIKAKWIYNKPFPIQKLRALFSKSEQLRFRLDSGNWRKAVDNFYTGLYDMEPDYRHYKSILSTPATHSTSYVATTDFRIREQRFPSEIYFQPNLESFMLNHLTTEMRRDPRLNPFISKSAKLTCGIVDPPMEARGRRMAALLDIIGDGLLCLEFWSNTPGSSSEMLLAIKNCLDRVPHLVSLHCTFSNFYVLEDNPFRDGRLDAPRPGRFPPLQNLKSLSLSFSNYPVYLPFTRYFEQLVTLDVSHFGRFLEWYDPGTHPPLPNLKKLSVQIRGIALLDKLKLLRSPLKELGIRYSNDFGRNTHNVCPLVYLNAAQSFSQTLITFKVAADYRCKLPIKNLHSFGLPQLVKVDLPQLKCVSMTILDCGFGSADHLLKLAGSLEYLEINLEKCEDCKKEKKGEDMNKLQIHDYLGKMYASNIWILLPSLAEVHGWRDRGERVFGNGNVDWHYTRAQYEFGRHHPAN